MQLLTQTLATFQMLSSSMQLLAAVWDSADKGHFCHRGKFYWTHCYNCDSVASSGCEDLYYIRGCDFLNF